MTFSSTMDHPRVSGTQVKQRGTFTNGVGDTGGDVDTVVNHITEFDILPTGSAVLASECVVNESYPITGKAVTIITPAGVDGVWEAKGRRRA